MTFTEAAVEVLRRAGKPDFAVTLKRDRIALHPVTGVSRRADDPTRPIGDALLDQRTVAGLGTIWRTEGCFAARLDPWRATRDVTDEEAMAVVEAVRPRMARSAQDGFDRGAIAIYGKPGQPCPRCGGRIRSLG